MANKKGPRREYRWSLYPKLHSQVEAELESYISGFRFHPIDDDKGCTESYDTTIMGRFICRKSSCPSAGWSSKRISITIRMYTGKLYNARVYHQQCENCKSTCRPILDHSYADRVAYRLKKWNGVMLVPPPFTRKNGERPHLSSLCLGCKSGHCSEFTE